MQISRIFANFAVYLEEQDKRDKRNKERNKRNNKDINIDINKDININHNSNHITVAVPHSVNSVVM